MTGTLKADTDRSQGMPADRLGDVADDLVRKQWGEDYTAPPNDPDTDAIPSLHAVAERYDDLLAIAEDQLDGRITTRIRAWEDGEVEIRAWHGYGPYDRGDDRLRAVLRYHSRSGAVTAAVLQLNGDKREVLHRETLTTLGGFSAGDPREGGG
jgi:hypothetical protein